MRRLAIAAIIMGSIAVTAVGILHVYRNFRASVPEIEPDAAVYPIRGIDVSAHNGEIDFERVRADGYSFVMIKATEGTDFKDRNFVDNIRSARSAGLKVGAYHFFRFDTDGNLQALNFLHSLRNRSLDFPAVIDVEEWGNPDGTATSQIVSRLRQMIERMEYHGVDVVLYTNKDAYDRFIRDNFANYPLWICSFTELAPNLEWRIWQYTHRGSVDGISGNVDLNVLADGL